MTHQLLLRGRRLTTAAVRKHTALSSIHLALFPSLALQKISNKKTKRGRTAMMGQERSQSRKRKMKTRKQHRSQSVKVKRTSPKKPRREMESRCNSEAGTVEKQKKRVIALKSLLRTLRYDADDWLIRHLHPREIRIRNTKKKDGKNSKRNRK